VVRAAEEHTAQTGMSDFLRPGDVSQLSQSDEVAFRVQFEGEIPPQSSLYWRGLVMSRLDVRCLAQPALPRDSPANAAT
jgi:hypothetical protein